MELSRIKALIDLLAGSAITELELSEGADRIRLSKVARPSLAVPNAPPAAPDPSRSAPGVSEGAVATESAVAAPMFGVVHLSPAPGQPAFVAEGSFVAPGDTLCLIEAMKVFSPVLSDGEGRIDAVLVADKAEVEAGQALFRLGSLR